MVINEKNFIQLLVNHFIKYPKMQIQDMYKLIYQNEFAGGHIIAKEEDSLNSLINELNYVEPVSTERFEDISNGLLRLNLAAIKESDIGVSTVNKFFVITANSNNGRKNVFEDKLAVFLKCCKENILPFDADKVYDFIIYQKENGYLHTRHSEEYRKTYKPSYRVIKNEYAKYFEIFLKIDRLCQEKEIVYVAIDGCCGSGKSSLSELIKGVYDCNVIHMDDFFLPVEEKTSQRLNQTGGNVDYERFCDEIIKGLQSKKQFTYKIYDCSTMSLNKEKTVKPNKINIIEGAYSLHPKFINLYDLKIFLHVNTEEQGRRIYKRNGKEMHKRFINEWIPMENRYFEQMNVKEKSDLVFCTD